MGMIGKASMDGTHQTILHNTYLGYVNSVVLDYSTRRVYWADSLYRRIEHSLYDGTDRATLVQQIDVPFAVAVYGDFVYWTEWYDNDGIYAIHKLLPTSIRKFNVHLRERAFGIIAVSPLSQPECKFYDS